MPEPSCQAFWLWPTRPSPSDTSRCEIRWSFCEIPSRLGHRCSGALTLPSWKVSLKMRHSPPYQSSLDCRRWIWYTMFSHFQTDFWAGFDCNWLKGSQVQSSAYWKMTKKLIRRIPSLLTRRSKKNSPSHLSTNPQSVQAEAAEKKLGFLVVKSYLIARCARF